jgi:hypothetical protein
MAQPSIEMARGIAAPKVTNDAKWRGRISETSGTCANNRQGGHHGCFNRPVEPALVPSVVPKEKVRAAKAVVPNCGELDQGEPVIRRRRARINHIG